MRFVYFYILCLIVCVFLHILLCLSAFYYNKTIQNEKKLQYKYIILFGMFYYISFLKDNKNKSSDDEIDAKQYKRIKLKSNILLIAHIVCLICFVISVFVYNFTSNLNKTYYDLYKNEYSSQEEVIYYTEDGKKYTNELEEHYFIEVSNINNKIRSYDCFIDEKGYLVIITNHQSLHLDESKPIDDPYCFYDDNGEYYADAIYSFWNAKGELVCR